MYNLLKCAVYTAVIVYFKKLIKHLNIKKMISIIKTALFNNYFNKLYKKIKIMLLSVKAMSLLRW